MRVLFVNPPLPFPHYKALTQPTLSFCYLAPLLKKNNYDFELLDLLLLDDIEGINLVKYISTYKPNIIAFHAHTQTFCTVLLLSKLVKNINPRIVTILGGPHASLSGRTIIERNTCIDIVFKFDAETSLINFLNGYTIYNDLSFLDKIPNIVFRKENSCVVETQPEIIKTNLNDFPKCDRSIYNMESYRNISNETIIMTSRGCPGKCSFCASRIIGQKYRTYPLDKVFSELDDIYSLGFSSFFIGDDTFACSDERTKLFCEEYIRRGYKMKWTSNLRIRDVQPKRLELMKKAGAYRVFVGFESFYENTQDLYNKINPFEIALKAADIIHKSGLEIHGSFIIGSPNDTKKSLLDSIQKIQELKLTVITFNKIFVWPSTALENEIKNRNIFYTEDKYWYERFSWIDRHPFKTNYLSPEDMNTISKEMYALFIGGQ